MPLLRSGASLFQDIETQASVELIQRAKSFGRLLTVGALLFALGASVGVEWLVADLVHAKQNSRYATGLFGVSFFIAFTIGQYASKRILRRRVAGWVDELSRHHGVPREVLTEAAKMFG